MTASSKRYFGLALIGAIAIVALLFVRSSKREAASFKHSPADTTYPIVIYHDMNGLSFAMFRKVRVDSLMFVDADSTTKVKRWTRCPVYYFGAVDSASKQLNYYRVMPGVVIADMNINTDSLSKVYGIKK